MSDLAWIGPHPTLPIVLVVYRKHFYGLLSLLVSVVRWHWFDYADDVK